MKSILVLVLIISIFCINSAWAESDVASRIETLAQELQGQEISGFPGKLLQGQRINIILSHPEEEDLTVGILMEKKVVKSIILAEVKEPTLVVQASQATAESVLNSANPLPVLQQALKNKEITYKAKGLKNKLKFTWISLFGFLGKDNEQQASVQVVRKDQVPAQNDHKKEQVTGGVVAEEEVAAEPESSGENPAETTEEKPKSEKPTSQTQIVEMVDGGFNVNQLTVKKGDTVEWKNVRGDSRFKQAMIIGTFKCSKVKSKFFNPGESYQFTFPEPLECDITDGIYTTQKMTLVVE